MFRFLTLLAWMALGWTCVINEICFGLLPEPTFDCKFIHIQFFPLAQRTYRTRWRSDRTRTEMCSDPRDTRTYGESECVAGMFRSQFCSKIYWPYACNLDSKTEGEIICTEESHLPRRCRSKSGEHVSFDYWLYGDDGDTRTFWLAGSWVYTLAHRSACSNSSLSMTIDCINKGSNIRQ